MKDLIILGAGGTAVSLLGLVNDINKVNRQWNVLGYLDDNVSLFSKEIAGKRVLGSIDDAYKYKDALFISSIAHPNSLLVRRSVHERVKRMGRDFAILIHPTSVINNFALIKEGSVIMPLCYIDALVKIEEDVFINSLSNVGHESIIGAHTTLAANVKVSGGVDMGTDCYIGTGVAITHDIRIDQRTLVSLGSAIVRNLKNKEGSLRRWIGIPAITTEDFAMRESVIKRIIKRMNNI